MSGVREQVHLILTQAAGVPVYVRRDTRVAVAATGSSMNDQQVYGPGALDIVCEPLALLHLLYESASPEERASFLDWMFEKADDKTAPVLAYFALDLKAYRHFGALFALPRITHSSLISATHLRLMAESHLFSNDELDVVSTSIARATARASKPVDLILAARAGLARDSLRALCAKIKYLRLAKQLKEGRNPAINVDQQEVVSRAAALGLSGSLQAALAEIDARLAVAADSFDYKACVDLTRTALEEFVEEWAKKVEPKAGRALPTGPGTTHFNTPLEYLRNVSVISEDERFAIQAFYKLLSNQSAHKLGSTVELSRVSRSVMIEWLLLLSGRVDAFLKPQP